MKTSITVLAVAALLVCAWAADNAVAGASPSASHQSLDAVTIPQMLSYQGKLTDTLGVPVADTLYAIRFRLYAQPTGGTQFWEENQQVRTLGGLFSTLLGSVTPIGSVPDAGAAYLGMVIAGGAELAPRLRIASAAYAYLTARAANSDLLQGKDTLGFVRTGQVSSVTSAMITNGTIAAADLGQMGATTGQVMKWTGSAWAPRNDSVGGGSVPDSVSGSFAVTTELRVYGKGRIGPSNSNPGTAAFVAGSTNSASGNYSTVAGGSGDTVRAFYGGALSGYSNLVGDAAEDTATAIAGGWNNSATGKFNFVGGGYQNMSSNNYSVIGGGRGNTASGPQAAVGGGWGNVGSGYHSAIAGGLDNVASGTAATAAGGEDNVASGYWSTVSGGQYDTARAHFAVVGGGYSNVAGDTAAVVAGGKDNAATGIFSSVLGGRGDTASGDYSTVGGGFRSRATGLGATVAGGSGCRASSDCATVAGGSSNSASQTYASVGGGYADVASGTYSTVGGGDRNVASASFATVAGGQSNIASGDGATVPGGYNCIASGGRSFAAGSYARARGQGTFVWSDSCGEADSLSETEANKFEVRARRGVYFFTNLAMTTGMYLAGGASEWRTITDDRAKEDFRPVDRKALLDRVAALRVRDYKTKGQDDGTRHIGPLAQDFHDALGYGNSEAGISSGDADGVLLAAVQALCEQNQKLDRRVAELEAKLAGNW